MTPKEAKNEWLRCSGLNYSKNDIWLRNKTAALFEIRNPTEAQKRLLHVASLRLTVMDLPVAGCFDEEFRALAEAEFGKPPSVGSRARRALIVMGASALLGTLFSWLEHRHRHP